MRADQLKPDHLIVLEQPPDTLRGETTPRSVTAQVLAVERAGSEVLMRVLYSGGGLADLTFSPGRNVPIGKASDHKPPPAPLLPSVRSTLPPPEEGVVRLD
jgi:hypothetical protein